MSLCSKPHTWLIIWLGIKFWIGSHIPLEQCCLVDFLQWWNCFISALSTTVATSQCGYWMLDMWQIYTWGTEFFILFHFTLNLNSCMWQWALAHWRHCFIFFIPTVTDKKSDVCMNVFFYSKPNFFFPLEAFSLLIPDALKFHSLYNFESFFIQCVAHLKGPLNVKAHVFHLWKICLFYSFCEISSTLLLNFFFKQSYFYFPLALSCLFSLHFILVLLIKYLF